ncbi:MAG: hypothetical protein U9Q68_04675 [Euryarchaeota archaeon]|nr:hypothetical protein [Euryarchaeota archaeon]
MALTTGAQTPRSRKARIHSTVSLTDCTRLNTTEAVTVHCEPCEGDLNSDYQIIPANTLGFHRTIDRSIYRLEMS